MQDQSDLISSSSVEELAAVDADQQDKCEWVKPHGGSLVTAVDDA